MKKISLLLIAFVIISSVSCLVKLSRAQDEPILILRQAKEFKKQTVAVEARLKGNILEALITGRMYKTKPKIHNAIIVGPRLGRLAIESKTILVQDVVDDEPYPTSKKDKGFITFGRKEENKRAKGTLTRELMLFDVPPDRVVDGKKYKLWVQIMSMQKGGKYKTFKFDLENLAELIHENQGR